MQERTLFEKLSIRDKFKLTPQDETTWTKKSTRTARLNTGTGRTFYFSGYEVVYTESKQNETK